MEDIEKLKTAVSDIALYLTLVSGATEFILRKAAYYCVATWFLDKFDRFAPFVAYGDTGVGKSSLMDGMEPFCFRVVRINISSTSAKSLREDFTQASPGTAIMEESEDSTQNAEILAYLKGRYARTTARASKMAKSEAGDWEQKKYITYGATIVHRRDHFEDQAMESRSIWNEIQQNEQRAKKSYSSSIPSDLTEPVVKLLKGVGDIELPEPDVPEEIPGRIVDVYEPLLSLAQLLDDTPFLRELINEMHVATAIFRDGQAYSPKALVFKALLGCLQEGQLYNLKKSVSVEREICKHLQNYYMQGMRPRTAAKYLRELGFQLAVIGGVNKVVGVTLPQLARVSRRVGVTDDILIKMVRETNIMDATASGKVTREDFDMEGG